jgi:hypothetical protein
MEEVTSVLSEAAANICGRNKTFHLALKYGENFFAIM